MKSTYKVQTDKTSEVAALFTVIVNEAVFFYPHFAEKPMKEACLFIET